VYAFPLKRVGTRARRKSMPKTYDTIIIGAGIAGATLAHTLSKQNQKVLVVDKNGIASGGSGAAGAFVSPKIGKGSALQSLTNEAFVYAKDFYLRTCPEHFHQTGVIRTPKDEVDAKKFFEYEKYNENSYEWYSKEKLQTLGIEAGFDSFYFPEAGDCNAPQVCAYLLRDIEVQIAEVLEMKQKNGQWKLLLPTSYFLTHNVILATGYKSTLADLRYMGIRGTWGTRGDYRSKLDLPVSIHQAMSVGANVNGIIKLGATHEKGVKAPIPCNTKMVEALKENASSLVNTSDLELQKIFCGMRAGSKDYFPLVGRVINVPYMLETYPAVVRGAKPALEYVDNLYVLNGLGGRGFVFAPLMAEILTKHITEDKEIDKRVNPDRLFLKWCRKFML